MGSSEYLKKVGLEKKDAAKKREWLWPSKESKACHKKLDTVPVFYEALITAISKKQKIVLGCLKTCP